MKTKMKIIINDEINYFYDKKLKNLGNKKLFLFLLS